MTNEEYQIDLIKFLELASKTNHEISVRDGKFRLHGLASGRTFVISLNYDVASERIIENLTWPLRVEYNKILEAERKYQLQKSARAKLTKEELEALGL